MFTKLQARSIPTPCYAETRAEPRVFSAAADKPAADRSTPP